MKARENDEMEMSSFNKIFVTAPEVAKMSTCIAASA